jgi:hypothetical protein
MLAEIAELESLIAALGEKARAILGRPESRQTPCIQGDRPLLECSTMPAGNGLILRRENNQIHLEEPVTTATLSAVLARSRKSDFVVFIEDGTVTVGTYSDGAVAQTRRWEVDVLDLSSEKVTARTVLSGGDPPKSRTQFGGSVGSAPTGAFAAWMRAVKPQPSR